jgi:serine/threonine-protein kinase
MRALANDPDKRFATVSEFSDALIGAPSIAPAMNRAALIEPGTRSIAVLPFANSGGSSDDEFLADGIAEELIHRLGRIPRLRVVARTSAFSFRNSREDARSIGQQLGARRLLTGSVRRAGNRLRISADLTDVESGFAIWSERYDRQMTDVFDVQDEIAGAIVHTLEDSVLTPAMPIAAAASNVRTPTTNIEAYEEYLRGRFHWNQRTAAALQTAVEHLERAVSLDPLFAAAHAAIAEACVTMAIYGVSAPGDTMPRALAAAERALQLDPKHPGALAARASVRALFEHDAATAEADYLAALAADAHYAAAHQWYAVHLLAPRRRFAEARAHLARARELDPLAPVIMTTAGVIRAYEGDHEQAVVEYQRVLQLFPDFAFARYLIGLSWCALGRWAEAIDELQLAAARMPDSAEAVSALVWAFAGAGRRDDAQRQLSWLEARQRDRYVSPVLLSQANVALGNTEVALSELGRALEVHDTNLVLVGVRSVFDPIRDDA